MSVGADVAWADVAGAARGVTGRRLEVRRYLFGIVFRLLVGGLSSCAAGFQA